MENITLALEEETLAAAVEELFRLMDQAPGRSGGTRWTRDELYERR
jgi:hypothetical protein